VSGALGYWMYVVSGRLRPAIAHYLNREVVLTNDEIALIRAYLKQWINAGFHGPGVGGLKTSVDAIGSRQAIDQWLGEALAMGIDPL
jgi:hypothetical protein